MFLRFYFWDNGSRNEILASDGVGIICCTPSDGYDEFGDGTKINLYDVTDRDIDSEYEPDKISVDDLRKVYVKNKDWFEDYAGIRQNLEMSSQEESFTDFIYEINPVRDNQEYGYLHELLQIEDPLTEKQLTATVRIRELLEDMDLEELVALNWQYCDEMERDFLRCYKMEDLEEAVEEKYRDSGERVNDYFLDPDEDYFYFKRGYAYSFSEPKDCPIDTLLLAEHCISGYCGSNDLGSERIAEIQKEIWEDRIPASEKIAKVAGYDSLLPYGNEDRIRMDLYRKGSGEYLLYAVGNDWKIGNIMHSGRRWGWDLKTLTEGEAKEWVKEYAGEKYEEIFGKADLQNTHEKEPEKKQAGKKKPAGPRL